MKLLDLYTSNKKSATILILVNLYPLLGVYFFGWDSFEVVILYCLETFVIGIFNVFKMIRVDNKEEGSPKLFLIPFFIVHYNGFVIVQSIFVFVFRATGNATGRTNGELDLTNYMIGILLIIANHTYSYITNYIQKKEYKQTSVTKLMFSPYKRIFIQQFMVIAGAFLFMVIGVDSAFLILLVLLKTVADLLGHYNEHNLGTTENLISGRQSDIS